MSASLPRCLEKGRLFRQKLKSGQNLSGAWSTLGLAQATALMARAGLDYVLIDLEHGQGGVAGLAAQVQALLVYDTAVMVRLPDHSEGAIKRVLDAGANIIMAPVVDTPAQASAILSAALFAPEGNRGVAVGAIPAADQGYLPLEYFAHANEATTVVFQIESPESLENLERLMSMDRVDGFFVGPNDLSASLGVFRRFEDPEFTRAMSDIESTARRKGKALGCLPYAGSDSAALHARGMQLAPGGSDQAFLRAGASAIVSQLETDNG
ncbi:HpcH/HpaI aldolase family protein [Granulosicoccus sp. 3-233]|uniref:HpcH/HpaI aldolase family protein n=1 Tax=Granulosicoccus sp. 3-233 TaxID=3417969 RepID=UPI003D34A51A